MLGRGGEVGGEDGGLSKLQRGSLAHRDEEERKRERKGEREEKRAKGKTKLTKNRARQIASIASALFPRCTHLPKTSLSSFVPSHPYFPPVAAIIRLRADPNSVASMAYDLAATQ